MQDASQTNLQSESAAVNLSGRSSVDRLRTDSCRISSSEKANAAEGLHLGKASELAHAPHHFTSGTATDSSAQSSMSAPSLNVSSGHSAMPKPLFGKHRQSDSTGAKDGCGDRLSVKAVSQATQLDTSIGSVSAQQASLGSGISSHQSRDDRAVPSPNGLKRN